MDVHAISTLALVGFGLICQTVFGQAPLENARSDANNGEQTRFVCLDNGQVVEGRVQQKGNTITVLKSSGSRIVFSNARIKCICRSLREVYWEKCAALTATDVDGHIRLFRWCLECDLADEARNQIDLLQAMNVPPSKLLELNQTLLSAIQERERQREVEEYERQFAITELPVTLEADAKIRTVNYEMDANPDINPSADPSRSSRYLPHALPDRIHAAGSTLTKAGATGEPKRAPQMEGAAKIPGIDKRKSGTNIKTSGGSTDAPPQNDSPQDPFDPEIFNRRYLNKDGDRHR